MNKIIDGVKIQSYSRHKHTLDLLKFVIPFLIIYNFSFFCVSEPYSFIISCILFFIGFIFIILYNFLPILMGRDAFFLPTNPPFYTSRKTHITERQLSNGCGYDYLIFIEKEILLTLENNKYFFNTEKIKTIKIESHSISFTNLKNETIELKGFIFNKEKAERLLKFIVMNCNLRVENLAPKGIPSTFF